MRTSRKSPISELRLSGRRRHFSEVDRPKPRCVASLRSSLTLACEGLVWSDDRIGPLVGGIPKDGG